MDDDEHALRRVCAGRKTCSLNLSPFTRLLGSIRSDQISCGVGSIYLLLHEQSLSASAYNIHKKARVWRRMAICLTFVNEFLDWIFGPDRLTPRRCVHYRRVWMSTIQRKANPFVLPKSLTIHGWVCLPASHHHGDEHHAECACDGCASSIVSSHIYCTYSNDG